MAGTRARTKAPQGRKNPVWRPVDRGASRFQVKNADPSYRYVGVYKNNADMGVDSYLDQGYEVCVRGEAGTPETFGHGRNVKPGEEVEASGHVLMRIRKDAWQEQEDWSQGYADHQDQQILHKRGGEDAIRGLGAGFISAENDTTQAVEAE